jgi:hypothetical protein
MRRPCTFFRPIGKLNSKSQAGFPRALFRRKTSLPLGRIDTIAPHPIQFLRHKCRGSSVVERRPEKAGVASSILAPGTSFVLSSPHLPLFSLQIECVRLFKSTGIPTGYARVQERLNGNSWLHLRSHAHLPVQLERVSERRFCAQYNSSDVSQFAREGCATLRKYAKLSEGDSQDGLEHHCEQPGYPQR